MKSKLFTLIVLASLPLFSLSQSQEVKLKEIESAWADRGSDYYYEGFTVSVLGGVRSEAMKIEDGTRLGTTGFKTVVQGQGVSVLNGIGYTFGLQAGFGTANYYRPPSDKVSEVNINVRNYEFSTFFGVSDHKHNMVGLLIGGGKSDVRKYRGYWSGAVIGAMSLPVMDRVYLGLQTHIGTKSNQVLLKGSNLFVELMVNCQVRLK